jgi:hypothetical protein
MSREGFVCRAGVADCHNFDEEQDPGPHPHQSKESDQHPHQNENSDPDPHQSEKRDPQHCRPFGSLKLGTDGETVLLMA